MKILVMINFLPGLINHRGELIEYLARDNDVIIACPIENKYLNYFNKKIKIKNIKINRRGVNIFQELKLIFDYYKIIKREKPDLILTYTIKPNIYASIIAKYLNIRYINNITGLGTSFQKRILPKILKKLYKYSFSETDCVFFQNQANLDLFVKNKILSNPKQKIKLIPGSGVNLKKFYPIKKSNLDDKVRFLFIGRLMDEKGLKEYLECAKKIKEKNENIEFQILGPFEEEKYKERIKELEEKKIINYLGVSTDIREQVKEVDCVINSSWHEGMSNVLLESGAMKKFLIASEIPGCKEIVINNKTGLTFEVKNEKSLEEQILKYLKLDEIEKEDIIENCYSHVRDNFSREKVIEEYMKVIKEGGKRVVR